NVKVAIGSDALETLMSSGFNLCLTRDVKFGGTVQKGNVIFAMVSTDNLAPIVELQWEDKYQVFETMSYGVSPHFIQSLIPLAKMCNHHVGGHQSHRWHQICRH